MQLVGSLLPALERQTVAAICRIDLPDRGNLARHRVTAPGAMAHSYRRILPNTLSRFMECIRPLPDDDGGPLLVLGDVPLRTSGIQTVFVHNTHVLAHQAGASPIQSVKFAVMRAVFRRNLDFVARVVVQTELMQRQLLAAYPALKGRVRVVRQPPPSWLLDHVPPPRPVPAAKGLRLFYPAAEYPHKNHALIDTLSRRPASLSSVHELVLTINPPTRREVPLRHVGRLGPEGMRAHYAQADALFFPSLSESYGLPLVEAMWLGMPIVCADLPYAHELCGDQAIYFNPHDDQDAAVAIHTLADRMVGGWRPDWSQALAIMPRDWDDVARRLVTIAVDGDA